MDAAHQHTILIVDDDRKAAKAMGNLLEKNNILFTIADSGSSAQKKIDNAATPFSLIIASQGMKEIKGTQVLEHAKNICPDTQRFLLTTYSDVVTIMGAVNKGSIQQCIQKPWQPDALLDVISQAFEQFERSLEDEKLLTLAKKQNANLYELNCELMETTKQLNNEIKKIEQDIDEHKETIAQLKAADKISIEAVIQTIQDSLDSANPIDTTQLTRLLNETIRSLHTQFSDIAHRQGFEMPTPGE